MKTNCLSSVCLVLSLLGVRAGHGQATAPATVTTLAGTAGSKGSADGVGPAVQFYFPHGIAVDAGGTAYVADMDSHTIRRITPAGAVTTLAGRAGSKGHADGVGAAARFQSPAGLALDAAGTLYVADAGNHAIRKITPAGVVSTLAGTPGRTGNADGAGAAALFNAPHGIAVDAGGTLYVADTYNHTIRKISPTGLVSTWAGQAGHKGSADGTGLAAGFFHPLGVAVDAQGAVYVADNGNHTIRKITAAGEVNTLAGAAGRRGSAEGVGSLARFNVPGSVAVGAGGVVYVADYINSVVRQITPQGQVSTLAGVLKGWSSLDGRCAEARFKFPFGVAVGPNGWLYVADSGNRTIRVIK